MYHVNVDILNDIKMLTLPLSNLQINTILVKIQKSFFSPKT